ncbi:craniofacial development protein 2-like [Plakobranchus ocellatus]|uniref:Craniofacial development protein 2-like n=1 Tax=Plakobranchus ocellatus TaxID=259542 RepID=A0AAV4DF17_9GAST|nr:craniofacial development protein 2-like [Plakobranchus ocellatus]
MAIHFRRKTDRDRSPPPVPTIGVGIRKDCLITGMSRDTRKCIKDFVHHVESLEAEKDPEGNGFHKEYRNFITKRKTRKHQARDGKNEIEHLLGLSEVRWKGAGKITSDGHEIKYSGGTESEKGVGIIVDQMASKAIKGY